MSEQTTDETRTKKKMTPRRAWKRWAKEIAIFAVIFVAIQWWQSRGTAEGPAPALEAAGLDGPMSLAALGGQATMVHFWATWCGVCQAEEGSIDAVAKKSPTITVAVESGGEARLDEYRKKRGVSFPVAPDPDGEIARAWGVTRYPTTFFVAPDGTIRSVSVGWTSRLGLQARLWWASLFRA